MLIPASQVKIGDMLDLQDDIYADPRGQNDSFRYELQEVHMIEIESESCVALGFDNLVVGFPHHHKLSVTRAAKQ